jgi:uridine nucleosidase
LQQLATPEVCQELLYGFDKEVDGTEATVLRVLFNQILTFFAKTYADVFGLTEGPPLHDPLAVAMVFLPDLFDDKGGERFAVKVVIDGEHGVDEIARTTSQCGRTILTPLKAGGVGVRVPRGLDAGLIWRILDLCLKQAEGEKPETMAMSALWSVSEDL